MKTDFHSHILPNMDDGARSVEESLEMLSRMKADGVDTVVSTSHFYRHNENIETFLKRRTSCYERLMEAAEGLDIPRIVLGAEVYFTTALVHDANLAKLCIGDTDYLLLEMPYSSFSHTLINSYADFVNMCGKKIIIAHVERYLKFTDRESVNEILSFDVLGQVNCNSFMTMGGRKQLKPFIEANLLHLIGSDCHNLTTRPPNFSKCEAAVKRKFGKDLFETMMRNADRVLDNAELEDVLFS